MAEPIFSGARDTALKALSRLTPPEGSTRIAGSISVFAAGEPVVIDPIEASGLLDERWIEERSGPLARE